MHEKMDQIIQNLSFEVVAVPQDAEHAATPYNTPIKVKVKMRKRDHMSNPRQGVLTIPKMKPTRSKITRTVHSDETIMSFSMHIEPDPESTTRRKSHNKFFHLIKTGVCLDSQGEDEDNTPYTMAATIKSDKVKSKQLLLGVYEAKDETGLPKTTVKEMSKPHNTIFGKCKPGGCLDPPFGEDNYQYYPPLQLKYDSKEKVNKNVENICCEYPDKDKTKYQNSPAAPKVSVCNGSDESSTLMLYKANSKNRILNEKYSDSLITYPTRASSKDLNSLEKTVMSRKSSSIKDKQLGSYFLPIKTRKSPERRKEILDKTITDRKSNKDGVNSNLPSAETPSTEPLKVINLLKHGSENVTEKIIKKNSQEMSTQSKQNLSHLVEISGNILLTIQPIKEPKDYFKCQPDEVKRKSEIEVFKAIVDSKTNIENRISKTVLVTEDDLSVLNLSNPSAMEKSVELQKLDEISITQAVMTSIELRRLQKAESYQDICKSANSEQQITESIPVTLSENCSEKSYVVKDRIGKENIANENNLNNKSNWQIKNLYDTQEISNEINATKSYEIEKDVSDLSLGSVQNEESSLPDLHLSSENFLQTNVEQDDTYNIAFDAKKTNEKRDEHKPHISDSLDINKISTFKDINYNEELDTKNNTNFNINNNSEKKISPTISLSETLKLKCMSNDNVINQNNMMTAENEVEQTQKRTFFSKVDTSCTKENDANDTVSSMHIISLSDDKNLSDFNTINRSNVSLFQNNEMIRAKNIAETDNVVKPSLTKIKQDFTAQDHKSKEISLHKIVSNHAENILPTLLNTKDVTIITRGLNSSNDFIGNIETNGINKVFQNNTAGLKNSITTEKLTEKDPIGASETVFNEQSLTKLSTHLIDFPLHDTLSSNISEKRIKENNKPLKSQSQEDAASKEKLTVREKIQTDKIIFKNAPSISLGLDHTENALPDTQSSTNLEKNKNDYNKILINEVESKTRNFAESEIVLTSTTVFNELPVTTHDSDFTEYTLQDDLSSTVPKIKYVDNKFNKNLEHENTNQYENIERGESYQTFSEIENVSNVPVQRLFSGNILPDLDSRTPNITDTNISNESGLIKTNINLKANNKIPSKQTLITRSSKSTLDHISNKQKLSPEFSAEAEITLDSLLPSSRKTIRKEKIPDIQPISNVQNHNKLVQNKKHNGTKNNIVINLGFQTYINENGETIVKTFDATQESERFSQNSIVIKRSVLQSNDSKLSFFINSDTKLSIKIDTNIDNFDNRSLKTEENHACDSKQRSYINSEALNDIHNVDKLEDLFDAIYENDLLPIERLIKNLRLEIDRITKYRHFVRNKSLAVTKRLKSRYSKACLCTRKLTKYS